MIRFNDLRIPFHRLALGTVLIDPDDIRYLKLLAENLESRWVQHTDLFTQTATSDTTMRAMVGDGAAMTDGIRYIGIGEYGIFEDDLKELMEAKVIVSVANELGLFDGVYLDDTLAALYPGLGETPYAVADSLVDVIV